MTPCASASVFEEQIHHTLDELMIVNWMLLANITSVQELWT